ncbi:MAG: L-serine ammonia-lyase, iron-sulfur-dependent, subunit alpha [Dialister sp.]|nr:L-serine ammonia-lyase, iron-sulfur-dependent, subunit alpha [Dialister sp.]MDY6084490.1 L-serine ammonia-lyase, iron-sulfur-dependent, subunit alpha [Dialister sp.]
MNDYHSIAELFAAADAAGVSPGIIGCRQEAAEQEKDFDEVWQRMKAMIPICRQAIEKGLADREKSSSRLVGGDGAQLLEAETVFLSPVLKRAAAYAIGTAEANAKMYRIVACPTAGSCGILPAVLAAVSEERKVSANDITRALFTAAAIGRVIAENACIAGAVGGCQAECGTATSMAAAACVDLLGGTTEQMGDAMALALKNILGLACDPVGGLVEVPCVKRNGFHAVHALLAVEMALAGIHSVIPPDDVIQAMDQIGKLMPVSLRETSLAGLAATPSGQRIAADLQEKNKKHLV